MSPSRTTLRCVSTLNQQPQQHARLVPQGVDAVAVCICVLAAPCSRTDQGICQCSKQRVDDTCTTGPCSRPHRKHADSRPLRT